MGKPWLYGLTLAQLGEVSALLDMPRYTAAQIASWLYKKGVDEIGSMTDLSLHNRSTLEKRYEAGGLSFSTVQESGDGTKKYLFPTLGGGAIESAYIPDKERSTLCISSQAGCRMGCRFCMTGRQGHLHNLSAGEILNQIRSIPEGPALDNIVYMGMGEPLDNLGPVLDSLEILTAPWGHAWSPTRITVSTIGVIPGMREFLTRNRAHIAVSLHNPISSERRELMPVENKYPIAEVVAELRRHDFSHQRRLSFEYIMFRGWNDTPAHISALTRLLNGFKCRINLIRFHSIPGFPYESSGEQTMTRFRDELSSRGITTTIRTSRGEDIQAACGLLSTANRKGV